MPRLSCSTLTLLAATRPRRRTLAPGRCGSPSSKKTVEYRATRGARDSGRFRRPEESCRWSDNQREGHRAHTWVLEAGTYREQGNLPQKVFVVERMRLLSRAPVSSYQGGAQ